MINSMDKERKFGMMAHNLRVNLKMVKKMVKEN